MASATELLNKLNDRLDTVEKTLEGHNKSMSRETEQIRKAFTDGSGRYGALTTGDGSLAAMFDLTDYRKQKRIGMGDFLTDISHMASPQTFQVQDVGRIAKRLESMKAYPANKHNPILKAVLAESSGATGGYTVPPQYLNELIRLIGEESFLRDRCRLIPMGARQMYVPALDQTITPTPGQSAFYGGLKWTWQPENANYQTNAETEPSFRQIDLTARDLVGICIASNQLLQDNAIALDMLLTTLFKESAAWAYDYYILRGTGVNQPLGMLSAPCAIAVTRATAAHFGLVDAAKMMATLLTSSIKNAMWIMHPSVIPELIAMTNKSEAPGTTAGFLVWMSSNMGAQNAMPAMFLGAPVFWSEKLPALGTAGCVMLVDPTKYYLGDRLAVQIEASPYPNFTKNQMTYRIIMRWDGQPAISAAVILADGVYTQSPIVYITQ